MTPEPPAPPADVAKILFRVAWMAIGLGLLMEFLFVGVGLFSDSLGGFAQYLADFVQKVSWSLLVCVGLALGTAAANARAAWMGLAGILSAPLAFTVARSLHKSANQALSIAAPAAAGGPSPMTLAILKAVEYGFLGVALAVLWSRGRGRLANHVKVGAVAGLVFGGTVVALRWSSGAGAAALVAVAVNEILFPVGCSVVLFAARAMGSKKIGV